ncbi:MAG: Holliday junction branch migration protein RuvA [candidate division Zixibacteria bacterium]|nr:Holliday junction branch migration protein RuvA [candidate division Zixibacteria bacterium]
MIAFVEGELVEKQPAHVVVSVGGMGFAIQIPLSTYQTLGGLHSRIRMETYFHVREDVMQLFGFASPDEKRLFEMLIGLSGIGPALALNILSGISIAEFTTAILTEDLKRLSSIPKVGRKTAQRLIMELRDRMTSDGADTQPPLPMTTASGERSAADDAVLGLMELGYDRAQARQAVARALSSGGAEAKEASTLIRIVLQQQQRGR